MLATYKSCWSHWKTPLEIVLAGFFVSSLPRPYHQLEMGLCRRLHSHVKAISSKCFSRVFRKFSNFNLPFFQIISKFTPWKFTPAARPCLQVHPLDRWAWKTYENVAIVPATGPMGTPPFGQMVCAPSSRFTRVHMHIRYQKRTLQVVDFCLFSRNSLFSTFFQPTAARPFL